MSELIEICRKVANLEVGFIPTHVRPLIAAEYEERSGRRLKCRCPDEIRDAAIWLAVHSEDEETRGNGAEGGDTSGGN